MRLVFYDKYDVEAGSVTVRDEETDFQCPLRTYSYRMQLINGGMTHFHFHSVTIQEIEPEPDEEKGRKKLQNRWDKKEKSEN